jgi:hypothetical protein
MPGSERDYERSFGVEFNRVATDDKVQDLKSTLVQMAQDSGAEKILADDVTWAHIQPRGLMASQPSSGTASAPSLTEPSKDRSAIARPADPSASTVPTTSPVAGIPTFISGQALLNFDTQNYDFLKQIVSNQVAWEQETNPSLFAPRTASAYSEEFEQGVVEISDLRAQENWQEMANSAWNLVTSEVLWRYKPDPVPTRTDSTNMVDFYNDTEIFQSLDQSNERHIGDCDDYALAAYGVLRSAGVPADQLLVMAGGLRMQDNTASLGGHAALVWSRPDRTRMIFDVNLEQPTILNSDFSYSGTERLGTNQLALQFDPMVMFNEDTTFEVENYQPILPSETSLGAGGSGTFNSMTVTPQAGGVVKPS